MAALSVLFSGLTLADEIRLSKTSETLAAGASSSFVAYLVANNDGTTSTLDDGCNAGSTNATDLTVSFTSSNTNVVATPASVNLQGCDNPATTAIENGVSVNYTVLSTAAPNASTTITAAAHNGTQGIRFGNPPDAFYGTFTFGDALVVTVADSCSSVSAPAAPVFSAGDPDGSNGWFTTVPSAAATSTTSDATISYSTNNGEIFGALPTLPQGTTTVIARATSATCNKTTDTSRTFKVDTLAPGAGLDNLTSTTWRNSSLSRTFTFSDNGSGLASNARLDSTNTVTLTASAQSANASTPTADSITIYDLAGNSTTRTVSALIDLAKPTISGAVSPTAPDGTGGWYKTAPTVTFTCGDTLSGIASCRANGETTNSKTLGENTAAQFVTGTATDSAGNTETATVTGLKVDLSNPTNVQFVGGPAAGSTNTLGSVPAAPTCTAQDAISELASCEVTGYSNGLGSHTITATATDNAGRTATATRSYSVVYNFTGFFQPVENLPYRNTVKAGRSIPVKFKLGGDQGLDIFKSTGPTSASITCDASPSDAVETTTLSNSGLSYDAVSQTYTYTWKTDSAWAGKCRTFYLNLKDGSAHSFEIAALK